MTKRNLMKKHNVFMLMPEAEADRPLSEKEEKFFEKIRDKKKRIS